MKIRLKEGKSEIWLDWCKELKARHGEVLETLKNEGVSVEACFYSESEQCIYYFMLASDLEKAKEAFQKSHFPIDEEHRQKKATSFECAEKLECLFLFENM